MNMSIDIKAKLNFLIRAVVAIGLLILLVNLLQRKAVISEANHNLRLLSGVKAKFVEDHFISLNERIKAFSAAKQTVDAFNQLTTAFLNIENDNYLTSSITGPDRLNSLVEGFYKAEVLPVLGNGRSEGTILKTLLPDDNKQRILQYLYIAANPKPAGSRGSMIKSDDGSTYSYMHALYHPEILTFARQWGISDIIFVDYKTGYVVYSLKKNLDFATSLFDGPYKNSGLGMAFKSAIAQQAQGAISYTDASIYAPALNEPKIFISTPLFSGSVMLGALVFAIDNNMLNSLLAYDKKEGTSTTESLKSVIVGNDFLYRCDDPEFIADREKYIRKLNIHASTGDAAENAEKYRSTSLVQRVDEKVFYSALKGKEGFVKYSTETGSKALCYYTPLKISNLNWMLLTQVDRSDVLAPLKHFILKLTGMALLIALILWYISGMINNSVTKRLNVIKNNIAMLVNGKPVELIGQDSEDEIGFVGKALNQLDQRLVEISEFITGLSKGNINTEFPVLGENDRLGISMNSLRQNLVAWRADEENRKKEDDIRNWANNGIAMFNDILRTDNNNLEKLSFNIIRNLVQYLAANQGGIFLIEEDNEQYFNLVAAYAFDRQKFITRRIGIGEGIAGTCVLEKKTILTNRIPDNYMAITSGLGGAKPSCLLVVPLKKDEEVLGVVEIASFENFKPHETEFVEKVAESIASALVTVKLHVQTSQYLERFQQQAEEMKAQDEELRQNIEELQATHEQMERLKKEESERTQKMIKEMDDYRKLLIAVINEVPEKIFLKDDQGRFIIANKPVAENYNKTVEEILGKSDFDFYSRSEATEHFRKEQEIIKSGRTKIYEEGDPSKYEGLILRTIKKPFFIEHLGVTGLFGVQFDITDIKRKEFEAQKMSAELKDKQHEIENASIELRKEKSLLDALLDNVPEHIYFKDKESRFIRFSKSMLKLFGLKKSEELLGKSDFDFFSDEHARPAFEDEQRIIATGKAIIDLEEKEVMEDGRVSWVNTTKMPLKDDEGNIVGTFGISKNISRIKGLELEAKKIEEEVRKIREENTQLKKTIGNKE